MAALAGSKRLEGTQTKEYSIIQSNFTRIVTNLEQDGVLYHVSMKVFENKLITPQCLMDYKDPKKAGDFVINMLHMIELDKNNFHVLLSCFSALPLLTKLVSELRAQLQPGLLRSIEYTLD